MLDLYTVKENSILSEGLKKLNNNGNGIVCIVNDIGELQGIFTDGDFRRAILNGANLTDSINKWMNTTFMSAQNDTALDEQRQLLIYNKKRHLPILIGSKLVDIIFLNDLQIQETPVLLMVGGLGSRLYPITKNTPKPMIKLGEKPILHEIVQSFVSQGFTNIILSVNYKKEQIMQYFWDGQEFGANITYVEEEKPLGTAGAISLIKDRLQNYDQFIVMNGDILAQVDFVDLLKKHKHNNADITVCARKYSKEIPFGVIQSEGYQITDIIEKPSYDYRVSAGIYMLSSRTLSHLEVNEQKDMPELVNEVISSGERAYYYDLSGYWFDIGTIEQLETVRSLSLF